tara:strand:+ start:2243 stop:2860 length:618 start_codon:yes stop_codon:yes gene_type:complete
MSGYWYKKEDGSLIDAIDHNNIPIKRSIKEEYREPIECETIEPRHWEEVIESFNIQVKNLKDTPDYTIESRRGNYHFAFGTDNRGRGWNSMPLCTAERFSYRTWDQYHNILEPTSEAEWSDRRHGIDSTHFHDEIIHVGTWIKTMYNILTEEMPELKEVLLNPHIELNAAVSVSSLTAADYTETDEQQEEGHYTEEEESGFEQQV